jgi:hypothetical protein
VLTGSVELTIIAELLSPAEGPVQGCRSRADDRVSSGQTLAMCQCSEDLANVAAAPRTRPKLLPDAQHWRKHAGLQSAIAGGLSRIGFRVSLRWHSCAGR